MKRITKNSSPQEDYEILKTVTDAYIEADCNTRRILGSCDLGHRQSAVNHELRAAERLQKIWKKLTQKYNFNIEIRDNFIIIDDLVEIPKKFKDQFIDNFKEGVN